MYLGNLPELFSHRQEQGSFSVPAQAPAADLAAQVAGILRSVAGPPEAAAQFSTDDAALGALLCALRRNIRHPELALNVMRTLGRLSTNPACRRHLSADPSCCPLVVRHPYPKIIPYTKP